MTNERTLGIIGDVIQHYYYFGERAKRMEKSNTREEILEAALDLFAVNGYEATSISQLADARRCGGYPQGISLQPFRQ